MPMPEKTRGRDVDGKNRARAPAGGAQHTFCSEYHYDMEKVRGLVKALVGQAGTAHNASVRFRRRMPEQAASTRQPARRTGESGRCMGAGERITRGILIGGALGAFSHLFGFTENMFMAVGIGGIAGVLAALTRILLDTRRK